MADIAYLAHLASELRILQPGPNTVNLLALSVSHAENVLRINQFFDRTNLYFNKIKSPRVHKEQQSGRLSSLPGCHADVCHREKKRLPSCYNTWAAENILLARDPKWRNLSSYPSATNTTPFDATATDVGLQKWLASFPGTNLVPRTSREF